VSCSTELANDGNSDNDRTIGSVDVRVIDALPTAIVAPVGTIDSGTVVTPRATIRNAGTATATIPVRVMISDFYSDDTTVTLSSGNVQTVSFVTWDVQQVGTWTVRCSTMLAGDMNLDNNMIWDTVHVLPSVGVGEAAGTGLLNKVFSLGPIVPNPFEGSARIEFTLPVASRVCLSIYDSEGKRIRTLTSGQAAAGGHSAIWNGADDSGRLLPAGCYFCMLSAGRQTAQRKVLLSR
jgi:hypothetical protein